MAFLDFIPLVGDVVGGISNYFSQKSANDTNVLLTRETNKQNRQMFDDQLNFTREMFDKQNEYNTPAAQRARYEQAGINPYMALGNLQSGNASSVTTPSGIPAVAPHVQANTAIGDTIKQMASDFNEQRLKNEQIGALKEANRQAAVDTRFKLTEKRLDLSERMSRIDKNSADYQKLLRESRSLDTELQYLDRMLAAKSRRDEEEAEVFASQSRLLDLQATQQEIVNEFTSDIEAAKLRQINSIAADAYASAAEHRAGVDLKSKQGDLVLAEKVLSQAQKQGVDLDNKEKDQMMKYVIESARLGNQSMRKHIRQQGQDYWNPFRYAGQILGGAAAGSVAAGVKSTGSRNVVRGFVP